MIVIKLYPTCLFFIIISLIDVQFMLFPLLEEAKMGAFCMTLAAVLGRTIIVFYIVFRFRLVRTC